MRSEINRARGGGGVRDTNGSLIIMRTQNKGGENALMIGRSNREESCCHHFYVLRLHTQFLRSLVFFFFYHLFAVTSFHLKKKEEK